jgi:hypothetical protein
VKKSGFFLLSLLCLSSFVQAWEMPSRFYEMGIDAEFGAANSYLTIGEFFNSAKTLKIDFDRLGSREFNMDLIGRGNFFLNARLRGEFWEGVGLFAGLDTVGFFSIPAEAMKYLFHDGDLSDLKGSLEMGGSVFADMGIKTLFKAGKFRFAVNPALYMSLFYLKESDITFQINGIAPLGGYLSANAAVYMAVPGGDDYDSSIGAGGVFISAPKGFDISLDVAYDLFPFMELGGYISHIPLYPAFMQYGAKINKTYILNENDLDMNELLDGGFGDIISPGPSADDLEFFSDAHKAVFRPLRFSAYSLFSPFERDWLALKPWIGFSVLTVYDSACFNFGLDVRSKVVNMLNLCYAFSYMEKVWQNKLTVGVNFRVLELMAGIGLRSQDFVGVWTAKGIYTSLGLRLGF